MDTVRTVQMKHVLNGILSSLSTVAVCQWVLSETHGVASICSVPVLQCSVPVLRH